MLMSFQHEKLNNLKGFGETNNCYIYNKQHINQYCVCIEERAQQTIGEAA